MRGGPKIEHLDSQDWFEVIKLQMPDGRIARVLETWIELSPNYVCFYNKWDPGVIGPRHGHEGDHSILITKGSISDGTHECTPGSHIMLEHGDLFGPWEAGPEGCEMYGVIMGRGPSFSDPAEWAGYLRDRGITALPVPVPPVPPWLRGMAVLPTESSDA